MSTQGLRNAFKKLAMTDNNLLTADPAEMTKYRMGWAPPAWLGNEKKEHTKGIWNDGVRTCVFPLIGVIDSDKSHLGDYGNVWYDKSKGIPPTRTALAKSKFKIGLTGPKFKPGAEIADLIDLLENQMLCLDAILVNANVLLDGAAEDGDRVTTSDWVTFEEVDGGTHGWIHATIGPVYESKVRKIRGKDIKKGSMALAQTTGNIEKEDIVNDHLDFLRLIRNHGLKHNEHLPCFLPNGERMGRAPQDLRRELYDGRWVRMDVEGVMWNMKAEGKRIFQLNVVRLEVLDPEAIMEPTVAPPREPPFKAPAFTIGKGISLEDVASKQGVGEQATSAVQGGVDVSAAPDGAGGELVKIGGGEGAEEAVAGGCKESSGPVEGDIDSEATLSDASKKENEKKRKAGPQGGRAGKALK